MKDFAAVHARALDRATAATGQSVTIGKKEYKALIPDAIGNSPGDETEIGISGESEAAWRRGKTPVKIGSRRFTLINWTQEGLAGALTLTIERTDG